MTRHNQRPDGRVRCLHAQHGDSEADQAAELQALSPESAVFVVAGDDQAPDGMIGAEIDTVAGRAWLRGPLLRPLPAPDAAALRQELIQALLAAMPDVSRFDAFPQADESPLVEAYAACGFRAVMRHHVMTRDAPPAPHTLPPAIRAAGPGDACLAVLGPLHDRLFPRTYLPGDALASGLADDARRLWVAEDTSGLLGYAHVQQQPQAQEGYVDYLGVDERARGQGWGRALLEAAVNWAMIERGLPRVSLTVRQDRAPALGLYRAARFQEVAAGWQMVLERDGAGPA